MLGFDVLPFVLACNDSIQLVDLGLKFAKFFLTSFARRNDLH